MVSKVITIGQVQKGGKNDIFLIVPYHLLSIKYQVLMKAT